MTATDTRTLHVLHVPADPAQPITWIDVPHRWEALAHAIGAKYIEPVRTLFPGVALVADEEGLLTGRRSNPRIAGILYPGLIVGDVLVCCETYDPIEGLEFASLTGDDQLHRLRGLGIHPQAGPMTPADLPIYSPSRDHRFSHAEYAITHIENTWCRKGPEGCLNATVDAEYPSQNCPLHLVNLVFGLPVRQIRDNGDAGLVCLSYRDATQQTGPDLLGGES